MVEAFGGDAVIAAALARLVEGSDVRAAIYVSFQAADPTVWVSAGGETVALGGEGSAILRVEDGVLRVAAPEGTGGQGVVRVYSLPDPPGVFEYAYTPDGVALVNPATGMPVASAVNDVGFVVGELLAPGGPTLPFMPGSSVRLEVPGDAGSRGEVFLLISVVDSFGERRAAAGVVDADRSELKGSLTVRVAGPGGASEYRFGPRTPMTGLYLVPAAPGSAVEVVNDGYTAYSIDYIVMVPSKCVASVDLPAAEKVIPVGPGVVEERVTPGLLLVDVSLGEQGQPMGGAASTPSTADLSRYDGPIAVWSPPTRVPPESRAASLVLVLEGPGEYTVDIDRLTVLSKVVITAGSAKAGAGDGRLVYAFHSAAIKAVDAGFGNTILLLEAGSTAIIEGGLPCKGDEPIKVHIDLATSTKGSTIAVLAGYAEVNGEKKGFNEGDLQGAYVLPEAVNVLLTGSEPRPIVIKEYGYNDEASAHLARHVEKTRITLVYEPTGRETSVEAAVDLVVSYYIPFHIDKADFELLLGIQAGSTAECEPSPWPSAGLHLPIILNP